MKGEGVQTQTRRDVRSERMLAICIFSSGIGGGGGAFLFCDLAKRGGAWG